MLEECGLIRRGNDGHSVERRPPFDRDKIAGIDRLKYVPALILCSFQVHLSDQPDFTGPLPKPRQRPFHPA